MWSSYSAREAAELVGLTESAIRACVRAKIVCPQEKGVPLRFAFRDILVLRVVKSLTGQGVPPRRVRRQLGELQRRLASRASLAELSIAAHGGNVVVRDTQSSPPRMWRADNGQLLFGFTTDEPRGQVTPLPAPEREPKPGLASRTAQEWFDRALELEEQDPRAAIAAYERALRLRPGCIEGLINVGRLYAESGEGERAADCFRRALALDPDDATALYNLGVVAQDAGDDEGAIGYYRRALERDPSLSEAHYNLATIFDRSGDPRAAIRHINEYRKLTRE